MLLGKYLPFNMGHRLPFGSVLKFMDCNFFHVSIVNIMGLVDAINRSTITVMLSTVIIIFKCTTFYFIISRHDTIYNDLFSSKCWDLNLVIISLLK